MSASCPLCGHERTTVVLASMRDRMHPGSTPCDIARCPKCGMGFTRLTGPTNAYPDDYSPYVFAEEAPPRPGTRERIRRAFYQGSGGIAKRAALFLPYLVFRLRDKYKLWSKSLYEHAFRTRGRVLDVGCGTGSRLLQWRRRQCGVVGVEPHEPTARTAREKFGLDVRTGTLEEQKFPDGSFDGIGFCHVLEHVPDPRATLREARRVVRPGGEVVVWAPNWESLLRPLFGRDWFSYEVPRHLWHFGPRRLAALLEECGLAPVELSFDPNEYVFRRSVAFARESGRALSAALLDHRAVRMLLGVAGAWFRRADNFRLRARKDGHRRGE